jgi:hypothetical protein
VKIETKFHAYDRHVKSGRRKLKAASGRISYGESCFLITYIVLALMIWNFPSNRR